MNTATAVFSVIFFAAILFPFSNRTNFAELAIQTNVSSVILLSFNDSATAVPRASRQTIRPNSRGKLIEKCKVDLERNAWPGL
jgi:hypothetical protein